MQIIDMMMLLITISLIVFVVRQKKLENKIDFILILIGAVAIFIVNNVFVWITIWVMLFLYFGVKYFILNKKSR
ncbi:hypothetical protein MHB50_08895 [Siminovitchia sp. FSL H7-0308]|uniref:Uncharacterized protein n=1 Tax=Siminovitchia thermophila TaxID=1245522 RepID=A0ABS2RB56_9BACI|nr:hypothetical protein [Siminovitchia thermophila]MBM7716892.1 hypothetical protein [Siminovitchia thermophila]ONK22040.1 hypothetical protein BLX87_19310 [Bacillus sp. VT-16-64]